MKVPSVNNVFYTKIKLSSFRGYNGSETAVGDTFSLQRKNLIHLTSFFRDPENLEFVEKYIKKTFPKEVKVAVGACSSGEEAWSLKMLLGRKAKVLGFDLGKNAIKMAKSGKFSITKIEDSFYGTDDFLEYKDHYLAFNTPSNEREAYHKKLFKEYFEPTNKARKFSDDFIETRKFTTRDFQVKKNKENGCKFIQGDILKLDEFLEPNSINVLTFRNALYHLTFNLEPDVYLPRSESAIGPMLDELLAKVNKVLTKDGLFVIGKLEREHKQNSLGIGKILYELLYKNGFEPAFSEDDTRISVWKKVSN